MCNYAKFSQNRPNGFGDIVIYRFSRWRPSAILDFKILLYLVHCVFGSAKFCQNRSNGCVDIVFNFFSKWRPSDILYF